MSGRPLCFKTWSGLGSACALESVWRASSFLAQAAGGIGGRRHGGSAVIAWGVRRYVYRRGLWNAGTGIQFKVIFAAGGAVAFARFVVAQAGQLIASADAVAVAGFGSRLNRNERHRTLMLRSLWILCK
jgi:hypothetical protein